MHQFLTTRPINRNQIRNTDDFVYILSQTNTLNDLNVLLSYTDSTTRNITRSLSTINKGDVFQYYVNYNNLVIVFALSKDSKLL